MDLETLDKKILELLATGNNTKEIAGILNKEGIRTSKGEPFKRKTINNCVTRMRSKGVAVPTLDEFKVRQVEPHIYESSNGKFRVRKSLFGKMIHETFLSLEEARNFVKKLKSCTNIEEAESYVKKFRASEKINVSEESQPEIKVKKEKVITKEPPKVSKIVMPTFNQDSEEYTVMILKGKGAKNIALDFLNNSK